MAEFTARETHYILTKFDLQISEDKTIAILCPKADDISEITLSDIKKLLEVKDIIYGIASEEQIEYFLSSKPGLQTQFTIAKGKPPEPGKNAEIKYYFDTDPLKAGTIDEHGNIDYKNRGSIPQVKERELIAEKIPFIAGKPGIDIMGDPIPPPLPTDIKLSGGKGVFKSPDGLKMFAKVDGYPDITDGEHINVHNVLTIQGDVGLETGHIDFDGAIIVQGVVHEGYKVSGNSLQANAINDSEISIKGDILVHEGIFGAKIKSQGSLKAHHIHNSNIEVDKDIIVEKEIFNSSVIMGGKCIITKGKILSSCVDAEKGIDALEIGSSVSKPCTLIFGVNRIIKKEIDRYNALIAEQKTLQETIRTKINEHKKVLIGFEEKIATLPKFQDKFMRQRVALKEKFKTELKKMSLEQKGKISTAIRDLQTKINQIHATVENLLEEQEQIEGKISLHNDEINTSINRIAEYNKKINDLEELAAGKTEKPTIRILENVAMFTKIVSSHSELYIKDDMKRVLIKEVKVFQEGLDYKWQIDLSHLTK